VGGGFGAAARPVFPVRHSPIGYRPLRRPLFRIALSHRVVSVAERGPDFFGIEPTD
jgi:hypothetical protein